jgi:hypothetical protein
MIRYKVEADSIQGQQVLAYQFALIDDAWCLITANHFTDQAFPPLHPHCEQRTSTGIRVFLSISYEYQYLAEMRRISVYDDALPPSSKVKRWSIEINTF